MSNRRKTIKRVRPAMNRFYVAASHIAEAFGTGRNDAWTQPTLEAAVQHGKNILHDNPQQEFVAIVQIVALLEREMPPVKVRKIG